MKSELRTLGLGRRGHAAYHGFGPWPYAAIGVGKANAHVHQTAGAVGQGRDKVHQTRRFHLGCTGFIPWCPDYPSTETMELFAQQVMPNFR